MSTQALPDAAAPSIQISRVAEPAAKAWQPSGHRARCPTATSRRVRPTRHALGRKIVNNIIYLVGLVVVVIAVLSFFGLR
jgi:hypothetical protein